MVTTVFFFLTILSRKLECFWGLPVCWRCPFSIVIENEAVVAIFIWNFDLLKLILHVCRVKCFEKKSFFGGGFQSQCLFIGIVIENEALPAILIFAILTKLILRYVRWNLVHIGFWGQKSAAVVANLNYCFDLFSFLHWNLVYV